MAQGAHRPGMLHPLWMLTGIVLLAAVVRLWDIAAHSLWADELYSLSFARVPANLLWTEWMARETNPPLFYWLLQLWTAVFGHGDVAVRLLPVSIGLLTVAAVFHLARALHSERAGLLAAALTSLAALQAAFSQEIRGYILGALFATLAVLALVKLADAWKGRDAGLRWLALYTISAAGAFHTHTTLIILPVLANIAMVWIWLRHTQRPRAIALRWIAANLVLALLCLWWLAMTLRRMQDGAAPVSWIPAPTPADTVAILSHLIATRSFELLNVLLAAVFGLVALLGAWRLPPERRAIVTVIGAGAPALLLLLSLIQPVFLERTVFWVQPVYLACLAIGLLHLPWPGLRVPAAALAAVILLADTLTWSLTAYREPWRDIARLLRTQTTARDIVLFYNPDAGVNLGHYCRRDGCGEARWLALAETANAAVLSDYFPGAILTRENLPAALHGAGRVFALRRSQEDPTPALAPLAAVESPNLLPGGPDARMALSLWRPHAP